MVRTIIQLPDEDAETLAKEARQRGVSKAAIVREALRVHFEERSTEGTIDRALAAAGSGASGQDDLAERHDDYLAERTA